MFDVDETLLTQAISKWGTHAQISMAIEECSELITTLCHWARGRDCSPSEEIADVLIMMHQLALMFGSENVQSKVDEKLERLRMRLSK